MSTDCVFGPIVQTILVLMWISRSLAKEMGMLVDICGINEKGRPLFAFLLVLRVKFKHLANQMKTTCKS